MQSLMIGELARRSGLTERALRHYEQKGLLKPPRTESGQRVYGEKDILRLREIQLLRGAGFTLEAIRRMTADKDLDASALLKAQLEVMEVEAARLKGVIGATRP
jgi:DNA-binding transcriptional MerR regulator